ncbi:FMN-binding protein [Streptococcus catagoni]|uniref:FMN-binding protein n=1 Tax=Streptococcus catagoni TaxID=2654874 RepID=UPI00140E1A3C|nr:FMN-binding protein [Streptococcus catagoni]
MKKLFALLLTLIAGLAAIADACLLFFKEPTNNNTVQSKETSLKDNTSDTRVQNSSNQYSQSQDATSSTSMKDGTYTGQSTSTEWGDVQLQIKVESGKMTAITVLAHPGTEHHSLMVNEQALPIYKKEALQAQSSSIDQVSGATETYKGFIGSLQDAINQAQETGTSNG